MINILVWITQPPTEGAESIFVLRLMVVRAFLWEGILKFVYVNREICLFTN